jgi:hypothetical protein
MGPGLVAQAVRVSEFVLALRDNLRETVGDLLAKRRSVRCITAFTAWLQSPGMHILRRIGRRAARAGRYRLMISVVARAGGLPDQIRLRAGAQLPDLYVVQELETAAIMLPLWIFSPSFLARHHADPESYARRN